MLFMAVHLVVQLELNHKHKEASEQSFMSGNIQANSIRQRQCSNLHSQMSNDGSLVPLQCLQCNHSNLSLRLAHEHLTGGGQHLLVLALDLHLETDRKRKCEESE